MGTESGTEDHHDGHDERRQRRATARLRRQQWSTPAVADAAELTRRSSTVLRFRRSAGTGGTYSCAVTDAAGPPACRRHHGGRA